MVHIDEEALRSSLQRLRQSAFDADVVAVLTRTVNAVDEVFGYSGAGIMFITESGHLAYVAASDEGGRQLEEAQAAAGQGPCYDSYVYAREIVTSDLRTDGRWPDLNAAWPGAGGGGHSAPAQRQPGRHPERLPRPARRLGRFRHPGAARLQRPDRGDPGHRAGRGRPRRRGRAAAVRPGLPRGHRARDRVPDGRPRPDGDDRVQPAAQAGARFAPAGGRRGRRGTRREHRPGRRPDPRPAFAGPRPEPRRPDTYPRTDVLPFFSSAVCPRIAPRR